MKESTDARVENWITLAEGFNRTLEARQVQAARRKCTFDRAKNQPKSFKVKLRDNL